MFPGGFWLIVFFLSSLLMMGVIGFMSLESLGFPAPPYTLDNYYDIVKDVRFNTGLPFT